MKKYLNRLWKDIRMWLMLQYVGAQEDVMAAVKKGVQKVRTEEKKACEHTELTQLIQADSWYQCKKCKMIFNLEYAIGWNGNSFQHLIKKLNDKVNKEEKCKVKKKKR